jgi:hypothetical protein
MTSTLRRRHGHWRRLDAPRAAACGLRPSRAGAAGIDEINSLYQGTLGY